MKPCFIYRHVSTQKISLINIDQLQILLMVFYIFYVHCIQTSQVVFFRIDCLLTVF